MLQIFCAIFYEIISSEIMVSEASENSRICTIIYYYIKTAFIFIDWTSFMNSDYWLGREEATWNDAQVIVDTSIFIKKKNQ